MYCASHLAFVILLSLFGSSANQNILHQDLQKVLSQKSEHFFQPTSYEENFRQTIDFTNSGNYRIHEKNKYSLKSDAIRDIGLVNNLKHNSSADIRAGFYYLQQLLGCSSSASFAKVSKQEQLKRISTFEKCAEDISIMIAALSADVAWAVRMFDAWGKPGSGLTQQNPVFLGEYDQCLETDVIGVNFSSQYCLQYVGFTKIGPVSFKNPFGFALGTCVPSTCTAEDVKNFINLYLASQPNITGGSGGGECKDPNLPLSGKAKAVIAVCGVFAFLMAAATFYDVLVVHEYWRLMVPSRSRSNTMWLGNSSTDDFAIRDGGAEQNHREYEPLLNSRVDKKNFEPNAIEKTLLCFSVYTNGAKVLSTKTGAGSIDCIHGIRFLSMSWVVLGHSFVSGLSVTQNMNDYLKEAYTRWTFQAILNALVSVDTFFTLSGLLMTYLVMKELSKKRPSGSFFFNFYFHRFWRLTPPYMLVMMVYITLTQYFGNGPLWPQGSVEKGECESNWWANLLYINNLHNFGGKPMCMGWSWYLANDMQFYIISPAIFLIMFYYNWWGVILALLGILGSAIASGVLSSKYDLQANFDVLRPSQGDYFDIYYVKPYCRIGPYLVGMITGYVLYKTDCKVHMSRIAACVGWAFAWAVGLAVVYGLFENTNGHPVSTDVAALYNALDRIAWGVAVSWVIFACATGYGGFINTILSWKALIPLSRRRRKNRNRGRRSRRRRAEAKAEAEEEEEKEEKEGKEEEEEKEEEEKEEGEEEEEEEKEKEEEEEE
ncbi:nose resistant to fluoxetine protein 6-like [Plakobranchus ocellatus]|uniref:Nose resistant to fluoxetine protein 6-like n=1 Tax=Plakobranchus ocellatus TaxID=259542 RepID=A0AAV3ZRU7_9GAST|nr:nose resistant to fluoxetine protein 6-like [Plakobranchus ocellatus]